jgi:phosphatidylglycerol:prolipoprotein diacylglycerol transferase
MEPLFFEFIGISPRGTAFEATLYALAVLIGAAISWREYRQALPWKDSWFARGLGLLVLGWGLWRAAWLAAGVPGFGEAGLLLPTYGVCMSGGFGLGIWLTYRAAVRAPDRPIEPILVLDAAFVVILAGVVGARALAIVTEFAPQLNRCVAEGDRAACLQLLRFWDGGLAFYGGALAALVAGIWWCRANRVDVLALCDLCIPYVAMGHAIGRIGCFAAGCCRGIECETAVGVAFPRGSVAWTSQWAANHPGWRERMLELNHALPVHPAQLYEALVEVVLMGWLLLWVTPRRQYPGQVYASWLAAYGVARAVLELYRGDAERGFVFQWVNPSWNSALHIAPDVPILLSTSQAIALGALVLAFGIRTYSLRRMAASQGDTPSVRRAG